MHELQNDNKRIVYNTILLYVRMLFLVLISLYTSRIVLQVLGVEDFGINNVVGGVITSLGFITGSLSGASSRFITFSLGEGNQDNLKRVFGNIVTIHIIFALTILIIGETIGLWFMTTQLNIPEERENAAFWVYQFSIFTAIGSFISAPYNAAIIAHEKMTAFAYLTIGDAVLKLLSIFILTTLSYDKLILYALFIFCIQSFDFIVYISYCSIKFKETRLKKLFVDKSFFKEILSFAGWTMSGNLSIFGYTQGLNILLNIFFNPIINTARGIAVQVQTIINNFSLNFQMALNPQLTKSYAQNDFSRMHELLMISSKFSVFLLYFICLPLMLEAKTILTWWLGEYPTYTIIFLRLILITSMLFALSNPLITAVHSTGKIKKFQIIEGTMLLMIVPIAYCFLKFFNTPPESVFIVHICIEILTQYARLKIILPMIKLDQKKYINEVIKPIILVISTTIILPIIIYLFCQTFTDAVLSFFIVCITCTISISSGIYFWGCNKKEKLIIATKSKEILSKLH